MWEGESEGREGMGRGWKGGCGKEKVKGGRVWGGGGRVGVGRREGESEGREGMGRGWKGGCGKEGRRK